MKVFDAVLGLASVLLIVGQSSAKSCKTCRGSNCLSDNVFELDCTKFVPALPFESMLFSTDVTEDSQYGCLDLSYYSGDSLEHLQQCILASDLSSYCDMLGNILKVKSCNIGATGERRSQRSADQLRENLQQEDEILEEDSTDNPSTDASTSGARATVLFSLTSLIAAIIAFLL